MAEAQEDSGFRAARLIKSPASLLDSTLIQRSLRNPRQQEVVKATQPLIEFPLLHKRASFNMEAVKAQIQKALRSHTGDNIDERPVERMLAPFANRGHDKAASVPKGRPPFLLIQDDGAGVPARSFRVIHRGGTGKACEEL